METGEGESSGLPVGMEFLPPFPQQHFEDWRFGNQTSEFPIFADPAVGVVAVAFGAAAIRNRPLGTPTPKSTHDPKGGADSGDGFGDPLHGLVPDLKAECCKRLRRQSPTAFTLLRASFPGLRQSSVSEVSQFAQLTLLTRFP